MTKPTPKKPTTRATTQKEKEEATKKKKTTKNNKEESRKRRKFVAQPDSDEEKIELEENNQFKVVSHPPKSSIEKSCAKIRNGDLKDLKK